MGNINSAMTTPINEAAVHAVIPVVFVAIPVVFVAIPLPFTGAWTAMIAAFVFGIPFYRAFPLILFGVIIAGVIVSMITLGILNI